MKSKEFGSELKKLYPVVEPRLSDSGAVDCCLEFLVMAGGRSLPEVSFGLLLHAWFYIHEITQVFISTVALRSVETACNDFRSNDTHYSKR